MHSSEAVARSGDGTQVRILVPREARGRMVTGGRCFVAMACYGDSNHPNVVRLRRLRDEILRNHVMGWRFIAWYYRRGPALARLIEHRPTLRCPCRLALALVARMMA